MAKKIDLRSKKTFISVFLGVILLFSTVLAAAENGYTPEDTGIIDVGNNKDIYLNIDGPMLERFGGKTTDAVVADLKAALKQLGQGRGENGADLYNDVNVRLRSNMATIDTTDLSSWYVYDHYDDGQALSSFAAVSKGETPYAADDTRFNKKRPYFAARETRANSNYTQDTLYTIESLLASRNGVLSGSGNVARLKEHIYSYSDSSSASHMVFMGYGANFNAGSRNYISDFLFYPTEETGEKTIEFTIDSNDVRTHSLVGAGFLLNAGVEHHATDSAQDVLKGYVLYIKLYDDSVTNTPPTRAVMTLYKINDGVLVKNIHENPSSKTLFESSYLTQVATVSEGLVGTADFSSLMRLKITFDETKLKSVTKTKLIRGTGGNPHTADGSPVPIKFGGNTSVDMTSTGYNGFGPLVDYTGSGHTCATTSAYTFTDLKMEFAVEVFGALKDAQYFTSQNTDRYFINLISQEISKNGTDDFWEGVARLRSDGIFYISNQDDGIVGADGINGTNGLRTTDTLSYSDFIAEIAAYIHRGTDWVDDGIKDLEEAIPVASFDIAGTDRTLEAGNYLQLNKIERAMMDDSPVTVYLENKSEIMVDHYIDKLVVSCVIIPPGGGSPIPYDLSAISGNDVGPGGVIIPQDGKSHYNLFGLAPESAMGTYRVTLTAWSGTTESTPVSRDFYLIEDTIAPTVVMNSTDKTNSYNNTTGTYEGTSLRVNLNDDEDGWGVKAYQIWYSDQSGESAPSGQALTYVQLPDLWDSYPLTISNIPSDASNLYIKTWDWVGNKSVYELPVNPRVWKVVLNPENSKNVNLTGKNLYSCFAFDADTRFVTNESIAMPTAQALATFNNSLPGEYALIGFNTSKTATSALTTNHSMVADITYYPIFVDDTAPSIVLNSGYTQYMVGGVYEGSSINLNFADAGDGLASYAYGFGPTTANASTFNDYGTATAITGTPASSQLGLLTLQSGLQKLFVKATDAAGNNFVYELTVNPRVNTLRISDDNAAGLDLSDESFPTFSANYIIGQSVSLSSVQKLSGAINGFEHIGYNTSKTATSALSSVNIAAQDNVLYPIFSDIAAPVIALDVTQTTYFNDSVDITYTCTDNHGVSSAQYFIAAYDIDATPGTLTNAQINSLAATNGGWVAGSASKEVTIDDNMDANKRYVLFVKASDLAGNVTYAQGPSLIYDTQAPVVSVGGAAIGAQETYYLSANLVFTDNATPASGLSITYTKNGGASATVGTPGGFLLTPPSTGSDVYVFTVTDGAGNTVTRTVTMSASGDDLSILDNLDEDNVKSTSADDLEDLKELLETILQNERAQADGTGGATGATAEQIQAIEDALGKVDDLLGVLDDVKGELDGTADSIETALDGLTLDDIESADLNQIQTVLDDAKTALDTIKDNLTDDEKKALEDKIQQVQNVLDKNEADTALDDLVSNPIALTDEASLDDIIEIYERILERDDLTDAERADLTDKLDDAKARKEVIENVNEFLNASADILQKPLADLSEDRYEEAIDAYNTWNDLTEPEQALAQGELGYDPEEPLYTRYAKATQDWRKLVDLVILDSSMEGTVVSGLEKIFNDPKNFSAQDAATVLDGGKALIELIITPVPEGLNAGEQLLIDAIIGNDDVVAEVIDISLLKMLYNRAGTEIARNNLHSLADKIRIALQLTPAQQVYRNLRIYRIHDGVAEYLADLDTAVETYTIETDLFSTYVLLYDLPSSGGVPTGDASRLPLYVLLAVLALAMAAALVMVRRRMNRA